MVKFNSKALAGALVAASLVSISGASMAGSVSSSVTVDATLVSACEVSSNAAIHFGSITNLLSAGDKLADSGTTFQIACSTDIAAPMISSATARAMVNGASNLPFNLSLTDAVVNNFPLTATGLVIVQDGTLKSVPLYAKVQAANFTGASAKIGGAYSVPLVVIIGY
jgi:spore coat protein U-like protein